MKKKYNWMWIAVLAGIVPCIPARSAGLEYISEFQYDFSSSFNWVNLLSLDGSLGLGGGTVDFKSIHIFKTRMETLIPDWQTFSNIEEENMPVNIAILGYNHSFGKHTLFGGIRNVNEDYFISSATSLFTNSSCGIFPTLSINYPLANYPLSTWCIDYKYQNGNWNIETSLYNGMAHKGFDKKEHVFKGNPKRDGVFSITSVNYQTEYGSYFYGFALHNRLFSDFQERDQDAVAQEEREKLQKKMNFAWWCYLEQRLFKKGDKQGILLLQFSRNESTRTGCIQYAGIGGTFSNLLLSLKRNDLGIFVNRALFSYGTETACEFTWQFELNRFFVLQPAFHHIRNEGRGYNIMAIRLKIVV